MTSTSPTRYPMPFCRVELAAFARDGDHLLMLAARRDSAPDRGRWALPGGVVRIDLDADLAQAAARVALERTGHALAGLQQLCAVGGQGRDARGPAQGWALSLVYRAVLAQPPQLQAGKRVQALRWIDVSEFDSLSPWAFDHRQLADEALAALRQDITDLRFPPGLLPARFTLTQLQKTCEVVLGEALEKSNFRRKLRERAVVEAVHGEFQTGPFRPAALYRLASTARISSPGQAAKTTSPC